MTAQTRRRIFVDHGEAYGNLGDEAMLLNALRRLELHLGPCTFVIPREGDRPLPALQGFMVEHVPSPFRFFLSSSELLDRLSARLSRYGAKHPSGLQRRAHFARLVARAVASRMRKADYGLRAVVGALRSSDVFYGVGAADFNDFNSLGATYKCWLYEMARPHVGVVAVAAQGFGPVGNTELKELMRRAFSKVDLLSFRDHAFSAGFTQDLGPLACRTQIVGDEAFTLPVAEAPARDAYLAQAGLRQGEPFIAVHWRSTDYVQETAPFYPSVAEIFECAARVHGVRLVFFPMSYDVHSRHDDECCAALRTSMKRPETMLMAPKAVDVRLIKAAIGASLFTLGLSYHVHVFGLSQGVPAVIAYSGEYYRYKSEGLAGFYAPPTVAIDVSSADGRAAAERAVADVPTAEPDVRHIIERRNAEIKVVNDWTLVEISKLLRQRRT